MMTTYRNITEEEIRGIREDLSWLTECTCTEGATVADFFLPPGRVLTPEVADKSRRCPTRRQEVVLAYVLPIEHGYVGGLSPAQRRSMSLDDALDYIRQDTPVG
jgi:hypothetical protein